jgi:serine/threonine protein kinase
LSELQIGRVIGKGGFSVVSEINGIRLDEVFETSEEESKIRKEFYLKFRGQAQHRFVVKTLRTDLPEEEYSKGVVDLAIEANFLRELTHPNIITMRATANSDPHESKYFVVLDRLAMTLDRKINFWRTEVGENMGYWMGPCGYCCSKKHVLHRLWMERLMVARDVAKAVKYLHDQDICYRDLVSEPGLNKKRCEPVSNAFSRIWTDN